MLHVTAAGWAATLGLIAGLLMLDWLLLGRRPHAVRFARGGLVVCLLHRGRDPVRGRLRLRWRDGISARSTSPGTSVEKSLSVDNLFVFVIIISAFAVPAEQQPKALTIGIAIALTLRAAFIALGAALLAAFAFMFLVFGLTLIATAIQLFRHRDQDPSLEDNVLVAVARRALPLSGGYDRGRIVTRVDGRRSFTSLFLVLVAIGSTDVLFAFDSIPAVFGVTQYAYIVFAANAFALLGLRALFFLVSGLLDRLVYLSSGLALILAFIGVKLVLQFAHGQDHSIPEVSTVLSLAVVAVVIAVMSIASMIKVRRDPSVRAHAGSLRRRTQNQIVQQPSGASEPPR